MSTNPLEVQFNKVKQSAVDAISSIFPIEKQKHKMVLNKAWVQDELSTSDYGGQLKSKAKEGTWGVPVMVDLSLVDVASGKTIDHVSKLKLFTLPKLTPRGSYIVKGNEYQVSNQLRLKPGVYTKKTKDGSIKTQFNLAKGGGAELHISDDNIIQMKVGSSKIPLYPLLVGMGMDSAHIRKSWGDKLYHQNANSGVTPQKAVQKMSASYADSKSTNHETAFEDLKSFIREKTKINPAMTKLTVGAEHSTFNPNLWLDASKKLINVTSGTADLDEVDNLAYKEFIGIDDSIKERLEKNKKSIENKIRRNLDSRTKIKEILNLGTFGNLIDSFFTEDERSSPSEQINPLHMISSADKITFMGPGSISNIQQVSESMRNLHPTHLSFIDPLATPEGEKIGLTLSMALGTEKRDNDIVNSFWDVKGKRYVKLSPLELYDKNVAFPDDWDSEKKAFRKIMIKVKRKGKPEKVPASEVDYVVPTAQNAFSMSTNLIPFLGSNNGNRAMMASKQMEQAVALKHREAPLVQTQTSQGSKTSYEEHMGSAFSVFATDDGSATGKKISGKVSKITKDAIEIKDGRKTYKIPVYNNFPLNQKTFMHNEPKVAVGDKIKAGQLLSDSNYTKDGVLALGTTLKTAYIPYKGYNFEDGIVITDSAAKKLTSEHMHKKQVTVLENTILSKSKFVANFPNDISGDNRAKLDEDGIITKGTKVMPGDVVIAAMKDTGGFVGAELLKSRIAKGLGKTFKNVSEEWTMDVPGIVTDVSKTASRVIVYIKTEEPAKIGDKLCYDDKTEVLTRNGWRPFSKITLSDKIATRNPDSGILEFSRPDKLFSWAHDGDLICIETEMVSLAVTPDHSLYVASGETFELKKAIEVGGHTVRMKKDVIYSGGGPASYPGTANITGKDWLSFLAMAISIGDFSEEHSFKIMKHADRYKRMLPLLDKYGIPYKVTPEEDLKIFSLELYEHLRSAKTCLHKSYIGWDAESCQHFLSELVNDTNFTHSSKRIVDAIQYVAIMAGYTADIVINKHIKDLYSVVIQKTEPQIKPEDMTHIHYSGRVYCCTVPNHILMVRRNGKSVWCGNSGRHGNKGIITKVIADSEAPHSKDGSPVDIMLNPHGVISRMNVGQLYESALGKVVKKTNKEPYKILNFSGENYLDKVKGELNKHKIDDLEELHDPLTGKSLGNVHVGNPYILKLNKQSEVNFSVRGEQGPVQTTTMQPTGGGEGGAKGVDLLTMYSLLSHGARANLQEMATTKSENNPEYWEALKYGRALPAPKVPFVFEKLKQMLKASGVDMKKDGSKLQLLPLTDKQTKAMSKMEIETPLFVRRKGSDIVETKGGFVDSTHLGGLSGDHWGHISLKEEMPNPLFEDPIKMLTGLVSKDYNSILHGDKSIDIDGKKYTGGIAIKKLLQKIDVKKEMDDLKVKMPKLKDDGLNKAIKKYRILNALDSNKLDPAEAYVRKNVPVIPPKFRPISLMEGGNIAADDANHLYRNVALINQQMKLPVTELLDDEDLASSRKELYKQMRGLTGLETVKFSGRDKTGFIESIKGTRQPKEGFFQNKVLKKSQVLTGRATIIPEPNLHMDEVALPEKMAWKLYNPFIVKNLIRKGFSAKGASAELDKTSVTARKALDEVMSERPVMLNRAPSLHKASILAFRPKLTSGLAIKIPPLVTTSFNADFDGDTMTAHIPVSDKAVRESFAMMPSRNLYKPGTNSLIVGPSQESLLGFYLLTKTVAGRAALNKLLPKGFTITKTLSKKESSSLFLEISKSIPNEAFSVLIDKIKVMGETHAYDTGFTVGIRDLEVMKDRNKYVRQVEEESLKYKQGKQGIGGFLEKYLGIKKNMEADMDAQYKGKNNAFHEMVTSGARGNREQMRQIVATPLVVNDVTGRPVPNPISNSFSEGLKLSDYWTAAYGARKGMMDRSIETKDPGMLNKGLITATIDNVISMQDCGTDEGIKMMSDDPSILGRFTQGTQAGLPKNTLITQDIVKRLGKSVMVRSPLKCKAPRGTCRKCYGVDESGKLVNIGDNVGVKAAQAMAEPLSQGVMNTFHTGGTAGTGKSGLPRIRELLTMPKRISRGKAVLAKISGKVTKIEPSGLKGFIVYVGNIRHITAPGQPLIVRVGDSLEAGDKLTEGVTSPQELLQHKGMPAVQHYLTSELQGAYRDQGMNIDKKTFETVVRSLTNRTTVTNNAKGSPWLPGESVSLSAVDDYNKNKKHDEEHTTHNPYIKGIDQLPATRQDWLAQMGARYLKNAIVNGASQGWMSDVKGYHPIPAYAYGAEFGEGEEGRY